MGRRYTNKSEDLSITNNHSTQYGMTHLKLPSFKTITYQEKIGVHFDGSPHYAEAELITNKPIPEGMKVIKYEDTTSLILNQCPDCKTEARPRIVRKSNKFNYHYNVKNDSTKNPSNRPDEYRLIYFHKKGGKTEPCIMENFDKNHGIFTKKGKLNTKIIESFFPYFIKPLRRELRDFESFKNFFNAI